MAETISPVVAATQIVETSHEENAEVEKWDCSILNHFEQEFLSVMRVIVEPGIFNDVISTLSLLKILSCDDIDGITNEDNDGFCALMKELTPTQATRRNLHDYDIVLAQIVKLRGRKIAKPKTNDRLNSMFNTKRIWEEGRVPPKTDVKILFSTLTNYKI